MSEATLQRGACAIVGVAESDLGQVAEGLSPMDLMGQAIGRALDDAGLSLRDVDGLFATTSQSRMPTLALAEYLGIRPRYHDGTNIGGCSFMSMVAHAQLAIQAGLCEVAVIAYGSKAWEKEPLTVEDVLKARPVSSPLTVRDCCLVTDGGGALIVTSAERARTLKSKPAYVLGVGEDLGHYSISNMPDLTVTGAVRSGAAAYAMAGLQPSDIDVVQVYDAFTITTLLFLEDLGFCPKGEGGRFVGDGGIAPGGRLPVNTNGGGLSYCHPGMYGVFVLIEAVRQLRGDLGARQVSGCETAIAHGNGGTLSAQSTVILGTAATV
jgi:acetyl-CoA acetyltransferase